MAKGKQGEFIASVDTDVPAVRSIGQIQALVERFGALEFVTMYDPEGNGRPIGVKFKVRDPHITAADEARRKAMGLPPFAIPVELRAPCDVVNKALLDKRRDFPPPSVRANIRAQAERVAWRNLHDYVRAGLVAVQTGILTLGEAFLANVTIEVDGEPQRFGSLVSERGMIAPTDSGRLRLQAPAEPAPQTEMHEVEVHTV